LRIGDRARLLAEPILNPQFSILNSVSYECAAT
jgi:hypothetical protein